MSTIGADGADGSSSDSSLPGLPGKRRRGGAGDAARGVAVARGRRAEVERFLRALDVRPEPSRIGPREAAVSFGGASLMLGSGVSFGGASSILGSGVSFGGSSSTSGSGPPSNVTVACVGGAPNRVEAGGGGVSSGSCCGASTLHGVAGGAGSGGSGSSGLDVAVDGAIVIRIGDDGDDDDGDGG